MNRYAVINSANIVVNVCLWDGVTEWTPGNDDDGNPLTVVLDTDPPSAQIGYSYNFTESTFTPVSDLVTAS